MELGLARQPDELCLSFAQSMLESLFMPSDCYINFTYLKNKSIVERYFRPIDIDSDAFRNEIESKVNDGWNIHYGICGRRCKSAKADDVNLVPALWVDLDAKDFRHGMEEASSQFEKLPMPTFIVNSGHGYQGIWKLNPRIEIRSQADRLKVEGILKGLAKFVNGDAVCDVSRRLRLPETINYKFIDDPVPCYLDFMSCVPLAGGEAQYELDDFEHFCREMPLPKAQNIQFANELSPVPDITKLPKDIQELITNPPETGSRSEAVFRVTAAMRKTGFTPEQILALFMNYPIGNRYGE